jgi:hypothetical protein
MSLPTPSVALALKISRLTRGDPTQNGSLPWPLAGPAGDAANHRNGDSNVRNRPTQTRHHLRDGLGWLVGKDNIIPSSCHQAAGLPGMGTFPPPAFSS